MQFRRPSFAKFRHAAITATAAAGFALASFAATGPASAQQLAATPVATKPSEITVDTDCRTYNGPELLAGSVCEQRKGELLKQQGQALDVVNGCLRFLKTGIGNGDFTQAKMLETAGGKVTRTNACDVARTFGYDRRASITSPSVQ